jgi:hypothetical protein
MAQQRHPSRTQNEVKKMKLRLLALPLVLGLSSATAETMNVSVSGHTLSVSLSYGYWNLTTGQWLPQPQTPYRSVTGDYSVWSTFDTGVTGTEVAGWGGLIRYYTLTGLTYSGIFEALPDVLIDPSDFHTTEIKAFDEWSYGGFAQLNTVWWGASPGCASWTFSVGCSYAEVYTYFVPKESFGGPAPLAAYQETGTAGYLHGYAGFDKATDDPNIIVRFTETFDDGPVYQPTPEPASAGLLAVGILLLASRAGKSVPTARRMIGSITARGRFPIVPFWGVRKRKRGDTNQR